MFTGTQAKQLLQDNFADFRITPIVLFLERLIERKTHGDGIEQYRIFDKTTNSKVTSFADFETKLDINALVTDYFYDVAVQGNGHVHPMVIVPTNFEVELTEYSDEDAIFTRRYGNVKRMCFVVNYLSDADDTLPMKVIDVRLY